MSLLLTKAHLLNSYFINVWWFLFVTDFIACEVCVVLTIKSLPVLLLVCSAADTDGSR